MRNPGGLPPGALGFVPGRCSQPTPTSAKPPRTTEARKGHFCASPNLRRRLFRARRPCGQLITVPPYRPPHEPLCAHLSAKLQKRPMLACNRGVRIFHVRHAPPIDSCLAPSSLSFICDSWSRKNKRATVRTCQFIRPRAGLHDATAGEFVPSRRCPIAPRWRDVLKARMLEVPRGLITPSWVWGFGLGSPAHDRNSRHGEESSAFSASSALLVEASRRKRGALCCDRVSSASAHRGHPG